MRAALPRPLGSLHAAGPAVSTSVPFFLKPATQVTRGACASAAVGQCMPQPQMLQLGSSGGDLPRPWACATRCAAAVSVFLQPALSCSAAPLASLSAAPAEPHSISPRCFPAYSPALAPALALLHHAPCTCIDAPAPDPAVSFQSLPPPFPALVISPGPPLLMGATLPASVGVWRGCACPACLP